MSAVTTAATAAAAPRREGTPLWAALLTVLGPFALLIALRPVLPGWAVAIPEDSQVPFVAWINVVVDFLRNQPLVGEATFKDFTRAVAEGLEYPLDFVEGILVSGFRSADIPPLPWIAVVGLAAVLGAWLNGWRLATLAGGCVLYVALFGKWKLSMVTLSVILVAAPIAVVIGIALGVWAVKWRPFERVLMPVLNVMQSLPHFSYLIPVAVFIGVSHRAGAIATLLFAMPPMTRLTILGLRGVSAQIREAGTMSGCTPRQMLFKVELPAARDSLMVGVNQVIMQCLAMVVIASFVGAKGLGQDLLFRLQSLRIGQALEIGVAIVLIAVTLDRLSLAASRKQPQHAEPGPFWKRHPYAVAAAAVLAVSILLAWITPAAERLPKSMTISTSDFWDVVVDWITLHLIAPMTVFRDAALTYFLIPLREHFKDVPWTAVATLVGIIGWRLGGWRIAATVVGFIAFIALSGYWERATITAYMVFVALLVCVAIGLPLAVWASASDRKKHFMLFVCDTFQTFPSFIYLIPVIMIFKVGDVAAIAAIVIYAMIPTVRYTILGLTNIPSTTIEAAITSGCTPRQILWKVRFPLAFPHIMLGVNQTIMFALFMVIIAAFIGTTDLGQEIFRALTFADAGKGLVIGLCVAFMGLTADRLITEWAEGRKKVLGVD